MLRQFVDEFKDGLYNGDPIIRSWFMMRSDYAPALMGCFYVLLIKKIVPWFMKNRKAYNLRNVLIVYNAALVIHYVSILTTGLYFLSKIDLRRLCVFDAYRDDDVNEYIVATCAWLGYMVKYVEFLDTVFFLMRKKDHLVTNLHVIHHATVPIMAWIMLRAEKSGFQSFTMVLNTIVHIIMYTYYCLAAFGPSTQKYLWWKEYLTIFQMAQFVLMFLFAVVVWPMTGCPTIKLSKHMNAVMATLFLVLFYNFYFHTYKKKQKTSDCSKDINSNGSSEHNNSLKYTKQH